MSQPATPAALAAISDLEARLAPLLKEACAEAVRKELAAGLGAIRSVVREELDREEESESEEEEESDDDEEVKCPQGCVLKAFQTDHDGYLCDGCKGKQPCGAEMMGCRACDFDLCPACAKQAAGPAAARCCRRSSLPRRC
eukprot:TRINITY_DN27219_c0_g1_i1.p1 TRINITY_DN27219_c0_g1~~TRINITY_DN27219_c0_g1_i1.p1  ORF type:complete len:141 (-),score=43.58 TRINITY_DN27219_c0_g1_i1:136-558(-)